MPTLNNQEAISQKSKPKRNARVATLAGVSLASALSLLAPGVRAQDAQTLLSQMKTAESKASYSAIQSGSSGTARVFRSGIKKRLEWLSPGIRKGDVLVDDGQYVTLYHQAEKTATRTNSRAHLQSFVATGNAKLVRATQGSGSAFRVPITGGRSVLIDAQTKLLLAVSGGGNPFTLSNIHVGAVPSSKFQFVAPAGVEVSTFSGVLYGNLSGAKKAADWLRAPSNLPAGWKFESAIVGDTSAWLRLSNGQNRISIFEQTTTDGNYLPQEVNGGTFWRKSGVRFLATGTPKSALKEIVDSLK